MASNRKLIEELPNYPEISELIPEKCWNCPHLAGKLSVYNCLKASEKKDLEETRNPLKKLITVSSMYFSGKRAYQEVYEMATVTMADCNGTIKYPVEDISDIGNGEMCGLEVRESIASNMEKSIQKAHKLNENKEIITKWQRKSQSTN